ncbi:MAG: hypothetical protein QG622_3742 [Actinomycetota bacterium]|nr:hypothetical protein [Actinomycetota bacterium]
MRSVLGRRRRLAMAFLSACVAVLMGATSASAGTLLVHHEGSPVKLSMIGGNIPVLSDCLATVAGGGTPTSDICGQFVTSNNTVTVRANDVTITALPAGLLWSYSGSPVKVTFNGPLATQIRKCLSGFQDVGAFQQMYVHGCTVAFAGNMLSGIITSVTVSS